MRHSPSIQQMRLFLITGFLLACSLGLRGQTGNISTNLKTPLKRADELFENYAYHSAIDWYKQALKKDTSNEAITMRIAECYRKLNDSKQAEVWYAKAIQGNNAVLPATQLYYAQALQRNGKYPLALRWYAQYLEVEAKDGRAYNQLESMHTPSQYFRDSSFFRVQELSINSPHSDFGASFYQQGIVFVSAQRETSLLKRVNSWDDNPMLDLYYSAIQADGSISKPQPFDKHINSPLHEGPATFYDQDRKMVFTRSNNQRGDIQKNKNGVNKLKLFYAERPASSQKWEVTDPFPFNNNDYSVGHPAITQDGKTLYFVSDMPGGLGGLDIYVSTFENGAWGKAQNLGKKVNTEGNEMFPFIDEEQVLYFSSDGHGGLGGLDICKANLRNPSERIAVTNLGYPANTSSDDFAFIVDKEGETGYFSSNRKEGKGNDDLYKITYQYLKIEATIADAKTGESLKDASVRVFDSRTGAELKSNQKDLTRIFKTFPGHALVVKAQKENYQEQTLLIPTEHQLPGQVIPLHIRLEKLPPIFVTLHLHCFEAETGKPLAQAEVYLLNEFTSEEQILKTDNQGKLAFQAARDGSYAIIAQQGKRSGMLTSLLPDSLSASVIQLAAPIITKTLQAREMVLEITVKDLLSQQPLQETTVYLQEGLQIKKQALVQANGKALFKVNGQINCIIRASHSLYESKTLVISTPQPATDEAMDTTKVFLALEAVKTHPKLVTHMYAQSAEAAERLQREIDAAARRLGRSQKLPNDQLTTSVSELEVFVVDAISKAPIEGAMLKLHGQAAYESIGFTKPDGNAKLPMELMETHVLSINKEGYRPASRLISKQQQLAGQVIPLHIGLEKLPPTFATLHLHCFEAESGKPLAQAEVYVLNEFTSEEQILKTDDQGNLAFQAARDGSYAIIAQQGNRSGMLTSLLPDVSSALPIQLAVSIIANPPQAREIGLEITVKDLLNQQPLPEATVYLQEGLQIKEKILTQTDGKVSFSIRPNQRYVIKTSKAGYNSVTTVLPVQAGSQEIIPVSIRLEKTPPAFATLDLHCFEAETNKPLAHAEIYLLNEFTSDEQVLQTDEEGKLSLKVAANGSYAIIAQQGNYSDMLTNLVLTALSQRIDLPVYLPKKLRESASDTLPPIPVASIPGQDTTKRNSLESTLNPAIQQLKAAIATEITQNKKSLIAENRIEVYVTDARTGIPLEGVKLKLFEQATIKRELISGKNGHVQLTINPTRLHILQFSQKGYQPQSVSLQQPERPLMQAGQALRIALKPQFTPLQVHFYDAKSQQSLSGVKVYLLNEFTSEEQHLKTDEKGDISFSASLDGSYAIIGEKGNLSGLLTGILPNDSLGQKISVPLYTYTKAEEAASTVLLKVKVINEAGETLSGVQVQVLAGSNPTPMKPIPLSDSLIFRLPVQKQYLVNAQKPGFKNKVCKISTQVPAEGYLEELLYTLTLVAEEPKTVQLHAHFYDAKTQKPLAGAKVYVLNEFTSEEQDLKADEKGNVSFVASMDGSYALIGEKGTLSGMLTGILPTNPMAKPLRIAAYAPHKATESEPSRQLNVLLIQNAGISPQVLVSFANNVYQLDTHSTTPSLFKIADASTLRIQPFAHSFASPMDSTLSGIFEVADFQQTNIQVINSIHYGLNKSTVNGNELPELDRLVNLMKANPWMKLTMQSHADSRQTRQYNQQLTIKRAKAVMQYLISKGIHKERISFKAFGESKLLNHCADGVTCDEETHSVNRRTELTILY